LLYKLGKKVFKILINFFQSIRLILVFLSFATVLYWILELAGVKFYDFITAFFDSIKNFMHLFYSRTVPVDTVTIDFSFLVATFVMLAISWGLKYVVESLEFAETKYDRFHVSFKEKSEKVFNYNLERQYLHDEAQNNQGLILIKICASNMMKDSHFNKDMSAGVAEKQREVISEISQNISAKINCQKKSSESELLISFNPFNDFDNIIPEIQVVVKAAKLKQKEEKWKIDVAIGIEAYAQEKEVIAKLSNLKKLTRLELYGEIVCLSTLMQRYSLLKNPKYKIEGKGLYTINDKEETVFCVERIIST